MIKEQISAISNLNCVKKKIQFTRNITSFRTIFKKIKFCKINDDKMFLDGKTSYRSWTSQIFKQNKI